MTTDTDPRVAEAMRLHKISTRSHHVWQTLRALGEQDERTQAAVDDHTALMSYLAAEFAKVPSAPVEAVPVNRNDPLSALAIRFLVAAGHVTQEKANEAFYLACNCAQVEAQKANIELPWVLASTPPQAEPDSRQNCRNFTAGKDGECVHCYAKAGQECQYEPTSDDALSDRYVEQRNEIARLTAELADEKAEVERLTLEVRERLQKQQAAEAEKEVWVRRADRSWHAKHDASVTGLLLIRNESVLQNAAVFTDASGKVIVTITNIGDAAPEATKP